MQIWGGYTIFEIWRGRGQKKILLSSKTDPEPARLSGMLFTVWVSHEINSEEKQPQYPAEVSTQLKL